jgi:hypothetical protein
LNPNARLAENIEEGDQIIRITKETFKDTQPKKNARTFHSNATKVGSEEEWKHIELVQVNPELMPKQQADIKTILKKHAKAFSKDDNDIGLTNVIEHQIDTGDHPPICKHNYPQNREQYLTWPP